MNSVSKNDLIEYFLSGNKNYSDFKIGTENEKFLFNSLNKTRLPYFSENSPNIKFFIEEIIRLEKENGTTLTPLFENEFLIGAKYPSGASLTLEPGGQFEISGAPFENLHQIYDENKHHYEIIHKVAKKQNIDIIIAGFDPISKTDDVEWMPKQRYQIMKKYMPKMGNLGTTMMKLTCTVQVNLDYHNENDLQKKLFTSAILQPIATALFANSSISYKKNNNHKSYRAQTWQDTDSQRCGIQEFIFNNEISFEKLVDYSLKLPMYLIIRNGIAIDMTEGTFEQFMNGNHPSSSEICTMEDWDLHLTTSFPEVRVKKFIEMRGADSGDINMTLALSSFWTGILYDEKALDNCYKIAKSIPTDIAKKMFGMVPKHGLGLEINGFDINKIASDVLNQSRDGLLRRDIKNFESQNEAIYLNPLYDIIKSNITNSDKQIELLNKHGFDEFYKNLILKQV